MKQTVKSFNHSFDKGPLPKSETGIVQRCGKVKLSYPGNEDLEFLVGGQRHATVSRTTSLKKRRSMRKTRTYNNNDDNNNNNYKNSNDTNNNRSSVAAAIKNTYDDGDEDDDDDEDDGTLILTAVPRGVNDNITDRKWREITFVNVQKKLQERGVNLAYHFPNIYRKLCSWVSLGDKALDRARDRGERHKLFSGAHSVGGEGPTRHPPHPVL